jgi:2-keto-4-pentenoate hydratase
MPTKKPAGKKFQSPRFSSKTREAAKEFDKARRVRKAVGKLALGKPKSSKVHKDYVSANRLYQKTGRALAKMTGYKWQ